MLTKYVAIGAAVLIIIAAVYAYFSYSGTQGAENEEQITTEEDGSLSESGNASGGAYLGSIADLATRGGDWRCTFDVLHSASHSSGVVYVSGQKIRGDFMSDIPQLNQTVDSHMIQDSGDVYVWTSLSANGFKAQTTLGTPDATTQFSDQGVDINQKYQYNCSPWTVDSSVFTLPTGVTFIE